LNSFLGGFVKYYLILFFVCFYSGIAPVLFAQEDSDERHQIIIEEASQYLPDYLDNIYIGMPLADFENVKDTLTLDISEDVSELWFGAIEEVNDNGIDEISYKFDKEEDGVNIERPLYQINIKFLEADLEDDFINQKFRLYSDGTNSDDTKDEQWIFKTDKDYLLIIKKIDDTVQIIATMAGTEWDPGK
jgi:hypothetical protein